MRLYFLSQYFRITFADLSVETMGAKKAKKNHEADKPDAENDDSDSVSSKIVMVLVTILIIAIWLGIFAVFVKADVGGFGSTVLAPALKDVPVLSKILPDSGNITASESTETAGYTNLDDAVSRIKELEKQLDDANSKNQADAQTINDLNITRDRKSVV